MKRSLEQTRSVPTLPPPTNRFPVESPLHAALDKLLHDSKPQKNKPLKEVHEPTPQTPENTELFAYTNALLYRVTGRYLPSSVVGDGTSQAEEVAHIQTDDELLTVIQSIKAISHQFHEAAQLVLAHRKELGRLLLKLETTYLGVFEKLLEASMRFYYKYRQDHIQERIQQRKNTLALHTKIEELEETIRVLTHHLEAKEIVVQSLRVQLRDMEYQNKSMKESENTWLAMQEEYRSLKRYRLDYEKREDQLHQREIALAKREDQMEIKARVQEHHHKSEQNRLAEQARIMKEELQKQVAAAKRTDEERLEELEQTVLAVQCPPKELATSSTQTEVDDDGLWDIQDGIPKCVSKDVRIRMQWRRFDGFIRCKYCHGRPKLPTEVDKAYADVWDIQVMKKRWQIAIASEWMLPQSLNDFLAHLPRSVIAFKVYSMQVVMNHIEAIYDAKFLADCADESDGIAYEDLNQFVCSYYLRQTSGRQRAEVELYRLLISVKALYRGSSVLRMFARFMYLLSPTTSQDENAQNDGTEDDDERKAKASKVELNKLGVPRNTPLNQNYLRVYLHARYRALHHPILETTHVICIDGIKKWIPLDYGLDLIKWYLSYLPSEKIRAYCRQLEYNSAIYAGGVISDPTGQRLAVRAQMRQAMLATENSTSEIDTKEENKKREAIVVVNMYLVLELLMDVLQLRNKEMDEELSDLFMTADVNQDKVLSFTEFCSILRPRVPHFTERRLLRMFRDAVTTNQNHVATSNNATAFSISNETFVQVCTQHGLVALISSDKLPIPFEVGKTGTTTLFIPGHKHSNKKLAKAIKKTLDPISEMKSTTKTSKPSNNSPPRQTIENKVPNPKPNLRRSISFSPPKNTQPFDSTPSTTKTGVNSIDESKKPKEVEEDIKEEIEIISPRSHLLQESRDDVEGEEIQEEINLMLDFV